MHANLIVSGIFALAAVTSVGASPAPAATPAPVVRAVDLDERGWDLTSLFKSLYSDVGGYVTSEAGNVYTVISEKGHSAFTLATGAGGVVTSVAGSVFTVATGAAGSVFEEVTSEGGHVYTIVTSEGGKGFTLAASGAGVVTTFAGSVYTAATGSLPTNSGAAYALRAGTGYFSGPVLVSLVAVLTGVITGARLIY